MTSNPKALNQKAPKINPSFWKLGFLTRNIQKDGREGFLTFLKLKSFPRNAKDEGLGLPTSFFKLTFLQVLGASSNDGEEEEEESKN